MLQLDSLLALLGPKVPDHLTSQIDWPEHNFGLVLQGQLVYGFGAHHSRAHKPNEHRDECYQSPVGTHVVTISFRTCSYLSNQAFNGQ